MDSAQPHLPAPNSSTDQLNGAIVHSFDPDASPKQKAASAGKAGDALKPILKQSQPQPIGIDVARNPPPPTITISDVDTIDDKAPKTNGHAQPDNSPTSPPPDSASMPGTIPEAPAEYTIPDWYKVGWRSVLGIDDPLPTAEQVDKDTLHQWISDMYYGQWYHNSAIIIFAVIATHLLTLLRMGWGWIFILMAVCSTYYSNSIARFRRNARDDIQRELVKNRLASEHETADWLNNFLQRFWLIYEPTLSKTIVGTVDQILSSSTPSFLDSLRLSEFSLGTQAPRIDKVTTFPRTPDDIVLMDWVFKFNGTDLSDTTARQQALQKRLNPKIVLQVKVGKGPAVATFPILVEDLSFEGNIRIKLKFMSAFPHVQVVEMSFLEKPIFNYVLKPIGGDTFGWDVGNIPGLSAFIRDMVHSILGPMMYDPNVFTLNLEQLLSGAPVDAAVGVLQVHVVSARDLKGSKIGGGRPDPFVSLTINNRAEMAQTPWRPNTLNPHWGTTHFIVLKQSNLSESLILSVMDKNEHRRDTSLGQTSFEIHSLLEDATQEEIVKEIFKDGKEKGELQFDVSYFPVIQPVVVDGKPEPLPETNVGICRLVVHQAKDLDTSHTMSKDLNPLAKVYLSGSKTPHFKTTTYRHTLNPVWEGATEFLVPNKKKSTVTVEVIDDRDFLKDPAVGYVTLKLEDILKATAAKPYESWFPLSRCVSGRIRISAEWKPLDMAGNMQGAGSYIPPIGVIRLWLKGAKDVKNVEATLGGKSDPYARVLLNGVVKARTDVINNNLNPEWDQIVYVPVHSLREELYIELMDYQHLTRDRSLGSVMLKVGEVAKEDLSDLEHPYASTGKKTHDSEPIRLDKNVVKGTLAYEAEFIPALNLKGLEFEDKNELERTVDESNDDLGNDGDDDQEGDAEGEEVTEKNTTSSGSDADYEKVQQEETPAAPKPAPTHSKNTMSVDTVKTTGTIGTIGTLGTIASKNEIPRGVVEMSKEELLQVPSGIIIFDVKSGQLSKKARLEILLDDSYWPAFATDKSRSTHAKWDSVGEGVVKELDFGRVWLRLNENDDGEKENILGDFKMDTKLFLDRCIGKEEEIELTNDEGRIAGRILLTAKYVPVDIKLEPRESINNMGVLRVDLLDGKDIPSADRGGKSDPFVQFVLNDQRVFKSQVKKKTLSPAWNENFSVSVPSRVGASFSLEVFDWNQIENSKSLGAGVIHLDDIEPFVSVERAIALNSEKYGSKGEVRIRLLFQPEIVVKTRKNTSTFSTAGRAMTQVGTMPLGVGMGVAHGVKDVGKNLKGIFGRGRSTEELREPDTFDPPAGQVSVPVTAATGNGVSAAVAAPTSSTLGKESSPPEGGSFRIYVLGAKDLSTGGDSSIKPYVVVKAGKEEFKTKHGAKTIAPEWDEVFSLANLPETRMVNVAVYDHKTLGKDRLLGEADIEVWRHLQPNAVGVPVDVYSELRQGTGQIHLRLEYERGIPRTSTMLSTPSRAALGSPSRFSLTRRQADD